ncbi:MAG: VIT1/CCC1 transporter family protein [Candidatus Hodarchaeales archaeon]|jgi:predicted membrane protein (TIGR00267 family)
MIFGPSISRVRALLRLGDSGQIAKRYFVMNAFDGALTALGIILGAWLAGITDPKTVILAGFGASIAMGVSGGFGAYLTESAMKKEELAEFEDVMLEQFDNTVFDEAAKWESYFVAVVDGISPFLASVISFLPFFLAYSLDWDIGYVYLSAVILTAIILFLLGVFLGRISKESIPKSGLKMLAAGIITGLLVMLLEFL